VSRSCEVEGIDELRDVFVGVVLMFLCFLVVYGDFCFDNLFVMFGMWDVVVVFDWEMVMFGDLFIDFGLLLVYWGEGGDVVSLFGLVVDILVLVVGFF